MRCHCNEEAFLRGEELFAKEIIIETYDCEFQICDYVSFRKRKATQKEIEEMKES